ncbi:MAG: ABC transporter permease [Gammaproteobacteria bacterium]|nr:ABC transporter permease [Rhodospirillaceae bacterium]MDE0368097.1 ABC transporter permease [Gammaproteobacteria bacterium]
MKQRIRDIIQYKTYAELKAESQRYYLGFLWWLIEPVIYMLVFYFVFGILFQRGTEDFVVFLLTGLVFWHWFQSTVMQGVDTLQANRVLYNQVFVPKYLFPAVVMLKNSAKFGVVLAVLLLFLLVYGINPSAPWFTALPVLAVGGAFIAGTTALVAAITPFVPDLRVLIENGMRALLFMSGIFYDINSFQTPYRIVFELNPVALLIDNLRSVLLRNQFPDWGELAAVFLLATVLGLAGLALMRANESRYAKIAY